MRLQGRITEEEMKTHPDQNRLYEALGGEKPPGIETGRKNASESDGFLLASDGLWENASQEELEAVFEAANLDDALRRLIQEAKAKGGTEVRQPVRCGGPVSTGKADLPVAHSQIVYSVARAVNGGRPRFFG